MLRARSHQEQWDCVGQLFQCSPAARQGQMPYLLPGQFTPPCCDGVCWRKNMACSTFFKTAQHNPPPSTALRPTEISEMSFCGISIKFVYKKIKLCNVPQLVWMGPKFIYRILRILASPQSISASDKTRRMEPTTVPSSRSFLSGGGWANYTGREEKSLETPRFSF